MPRKGSTRQLILLLFVAASAYSQGLIANVGNFIHGVSDLDHSVHFYKDVLGMDMPRPASDWQTNEAVLKMYDAVGAKFRTANVQIPGSNMRVELAQFQGVDRKPLKHTWGETGNSVLILDVADLAPIEARMKAENIPVLVPPAKACDGRGLVIADPDGFAVALIERGDKNGTSSFNRLRFGYLAGDALVKSFEALGLETETRTHICQPIEDALIGSGPIVTLPGGFEVWLPKAKPGTAHSSSPPSSPGAAVLRLNVTDLDAAIKALQKAGASIADAGGEIVTLGNLHAAILHTPDDLFIQVLK